MNRRGFLGTLAGAAVAYTAAPMLKVTNLAVPSEYTTYLVGREAIIQEYADYACFSDIYISKAINEIIENVAKELSYRVSSSMREQERMLFDSGIQ